LPVIPGSNVKIALAGNSGSPLPPEWPRTPGFTAPYSSTGTVWIRRSGSLGVNVRAQKKESVITDREEGNLKIGFGGLSAAAEKKRTEVIS
jgi:hypothetical protein